MTHSFYKWTKTQNISLYKPGNTVCLCEYCADVYHQDKRIEPTQKDCEICKRKGNN